MASLSAVQCVLDVYAVLVLDAVRWITGGALMSFMAICHTSARSRAGPETGLTRGCLEFLEAEPRASSAELSSARVSRTLSVVMAYNEVDCDGRRYVLVDIWHPSARWVVSRDIE